MRRTLLAITALAICPAPATAQRTPLSEALAEPHETMGDPPALRRIPVFSPRAEAGIAAFQSVQVNVGSNGLNIVGDAANEPSITVHPSDPLRIAVGWRQFDSVSSNFRQAGYAYSTDSGASWVFPGKLTPGTFRSDPVLATTLGGTFHYNSLLNSFFTDEFSSLNGGQNWTLLGPATGGDKQWIVIDTTQSQGSGHIYQWWSTAGNNYGGRQFSRSTNGGSTWMNPINIPRQPVWGTLDVAINGDLYLGGSDGAGVFWIVRSVNAKNAAVTPTFDFNRSVNLGGEIAYGLPINPVGLAGQCYTAVDKSSGPTAGNVYMLCSVERNATNPCDVMFVRSTDRGATWSAPVRVNDDPANQGRYHWFGTMGVAPNGRIDVVWNDTRNDPTGTFSELWHSYSLDGGTTWSPNIQVSPRFNHFLGYPNQNKMGDYIGLVSDELGCRVIYTATFNGEQDVYFLRIVAAPQNVPTGAFSILRGVLDSGNLASLQQVDSDRLTVRRGLTANALEAPIQVQVEGTTGILSPASIRFELTAQASSSNLGQRIELFNFSTGNYDSLDFRNATTADSAVTVLVTSGASDYVQPGTGKVRAKVSYKPVAPVPGSTYAAALNRTAWVVTP